MLLTVNEQPGAIEPLEIVQVTPSAPKPVGEFESVTNVSDGSKPLPDTETEMPGGPVVGINEIAG